MKGLAGIEHFNQHRSQSGRNFRLLAKECFKRRHGLMHQHAQAVDGLVAPRRSVSQQGRLQWRIDDIANDGVRRQRR